MDPFSSSRYQCKPESLEYPYERQYKYQKNWLHILRELYTDSMDIHTDAKLLFDAIRRGKHRLAKFILDASSSDLVNSTDIKGKTPLTVCCQIKEQMRRGDMFFLLLEKGADVNVQDDHGRTTMSYACETKCNDLVDMLIRVNDVDPDLEDHKGNTPLIYSSIVGNDIATDLLTRNFRRLGLEIDHTNKNGFTALLTAAKHGNISCARILAQQGHASLQVRDKVHGYSVQEWLKLGGYTLEDIVSGKKLNKTKSKYISITRLSIPNDSSKKSYHTDDDTSDNEDTYHHDSDRNFSYREDKRIIHRQSSAIDERCNRREKLERRNSYWEDRRDSPRDDRRGSLRDERRGSPRQERRSSQREDRRSSVREERRESLRRMKKQQDAEKERKERLSREIADLIEANELSGESTVIIDPNMPVANTMLRRKSLKTSIDPTVLKNVIVLPPINKLAVDDSDPSDTDANNTEIDDYEHGGLRRKDFICEINNLVPNEMDDDDADSVYTSKD
ncbi:inversin-A-like [Ylistrum balloti]|uniref:inversin-A-like n=1 Tax=Ylistrum balloti TaxID=509963 RepID=UPI002905BC76|nr:inversin-A-like [Ylistrum balloti]